MTISAPDKAPVLRTLSPALRGLERNLRGWLDSPHKYPLSVSSRSVLESMATDLRRQSEALEADQPLLVVMLMGGTGVGKSTLLNAMAGGGIAHASFHRPTTRDPVVYYHESVKPDRLDPALRHGRLVPHDRPALEQKILVDTPDLDSTDLTNRDKTLKLLPVADVVLYVGSQEKYHDQLPWQEFMKQRKRRAFAFVVNKWDRCLHAGAAGRRPDEDLLRDLEAEGFESPLLFRTCAQVWVDKATALPGQPPSEPPEGEQFPDLVNWLEMGLSRLEVEAIKAKGVGQLLGSLEHSLREAAPPNLDEPAARVRAAWAKPLAEEAASTGDILVNTLEPYQREIEHHFALQGHRRFHGPMSVYLQLIRNARYAGSTLRAHIPFISRSQKNDAQTPAAWDLSMFTTACSDVAANRDLDARGKALGNRLLVEADAQGFPLSVLTDTVDALAKIDWRKKYAVALREVLEQVEKQWTRPTGVRRIIQTALVITADWLPPLALLAALVHLLWKVFKPLGGDMYIPGWLDIFLPFIVLLLVLVILHLLIFLLLPMNWSKIRDEFHKKLEDRVRQELEAVYLAVPTDVAEKLKEERRRVEKLIEDTREVSSWLSKKEQTASVAGLYGN